MFSRPNAFHEFLSRNNYIGEIYDALAKDDTSEVVMKALDILKKTNNLVPASERNNTKSEEISTIRRNSGNQMFRTGFYQIALALYNQALLFAPKNSREMKLAYSNRSALFLKCNAWEACCNDINTCFAMGCPRDIVEKLTKRKNEAEPKLMMENFGRNVMIRAAEKCINPLEMKKNKLIPSVSSDVKVIVTPAHKIIASTFIKAGSVVASEHAYVSYTEAENQYFSCHYCQKKELNLIPCESCVYALFCNEECKNQCMQEFHEYECKIMGQLQDICFGPMPFLMVKACLKFKKACKSWNEVITASNSLGNERIKSSTIQEIYDTNCKYSILSIYDDKMFAYGVMYNCCFIIAAILHYIESQIPSFFPKKPDEKQEAMRALARIMMFVAVYQKPLYIIQAHNNFTSDISNFGIENYGLFPFISKLKNSCTPNLLVVNNNNKLILTALRPISSGEELTVAYLTHRLDRELEKQIRNVKSFLFYGTVCGCSICEGNTKYEGELTKYQQKYYSKLNFGELDLKLRRIEVVSIYEDLLKALVVLKDVPNSREIQGNIVKSMDASGDVYFSLKLYTATMQCLMT